MRQDEARPVRIPQLSVVPLAYKGRNHELRKQNGRVFRAGYYGRMDRLDCIWRVNDEGHYEQTVDHEFLYRHFEVINFADHNNWYGRRRPKLPATRPLNLR